jgi:hypothetical protein
MLTIFRRHLKSCPHRSRAYRRCRCPLHVEGSLGGEPIRRALDLTSWSAASDLIAQWNAAGRISFREETPSIEEAILKFIAAAENKKLAPATIVKLRTIFEKQLLTVDAITRLSPAR